VEQQVNTLITNDLPKIQANVTAVQPLNNSYAASTIIIWGGAAPVALGPEGDNVISTTLYGRGRLGVFGAQRMISQCCKPVHKGKGKRPALDVLIYNIAAWAAGNQVQLDRVVRV
jgi:hypothetical protein